MLSWSVTDKQIKRRMNRIPVLVSRIRIAVLTCDKKQSYRQVEHTVPLPASLTQTV